MNRNECSKCVFYPFRQLREQQETNVVEVKHGEWIPKGFNLEGDKEFECSLCGCIVWHRKTNFCPDCGAKMDERREDEEIH